MLYKLTININITLQFLIIIIIIISGFGIYGAAVVPDSGVGNTWQRLTLVLHEFLSNGLIPSRLHIVISFLTHVDHVFLGLPRFLVPGTPTYTSVITTVGNHIYDYHTDRCHYKTVTININKQPTSGRSSHPTGLHSGWPRVAHGRNAEKTACKKFAA